MTAHARSGRTQGLRTRGFRRRKTVVVGLLSVLVLMSLPAHGSLASAVATQTQPALAASPALLRAAAPPERTAVSADGLPTVQIDGVVWSQAIVGNTVFAGGNFATARPAGSAPGANTVSRRNLLSYDIRTGNLIASFAPNLNAQVQAVTASPDGSRIYVGGAFTSANGVTRNRIAAYNTSTGQLIAAFAPSLNYNALAIVATADTVYVGGAFTSVNGVARNRLAAFSAANGALLGWNPNANEQVTALVLAPGGSKLIAGGPFSTISGATATSLAAIDANSGALLPWNATQVVRNSGLDSGITSLATDGTDIFGTAYNFGGGGGTGNLEGAFAADTATGSIKWIEDCHGDTYSGFPLGGVLYTAGHAHACNNIAGFPEITPRRYQYALGFTTEPVGVVTPNYEGSYYSFTGRAAPATMHWFPRFGSGTATGQYQATWHVTANADYVIMGGEFPTVNNVRQQGLVRFARRELFPNRQGPVESGPAFAPVLAPLTAGSLRVAFPTNWDRDDRALTYRIYRSGSASPIHTMTADSNFWDRPWLSFVDSGRTAGTSYTYTVTASDPAGNTVTSPSASAVASGSGASNAYVDKVRADGAVLLWRLSEGAGSSAPAHDWARGADGVMGGGVARGTPGAVAGDTAATFNGGSSAIVTSPHTSYGPQTFTAQAWFRTTSTAGGAILGFGSSATGLSRFNDRTIYLDTSGRVRFGVSPTTNTFRGVNSANAYNDGQWHHVTATLSSAGMRLYVDGSLVGSRTDTMNAWYQYGSWRVGGDRLTGFPSAPSNTYFNGDIDEVAVYPTALTRAQVGDQYISAGRSPAIPPAPGDPYGAAVYAGDPELYWRLGEATGSVIAADSGRAQATGDYGGASAVQTTGAISGTANAASLFNGAAGSVTMRTSVVNPVTYSSEAWFKTTSTRGGRVIGFGDLRSGLSASYDRHIYLQDDGRVVFGVYSGAQQKVITPSSYNDGQWHHAVATQSADGMRLYLDGQLAGTNPTATAQNYTGYWRVGGDRTWGSTSAYLAGAIDEAAVYATALPAQTVAEHHAAGRGATNTPPAAAFTSTTDTLTVTADATSSTDADGTITGYAWNFGDGATATGATTSHPYATAGTYQVTLTVTDNQGATDTETKPVTVTAPPGSDIAGDAFERTTANGFGVADTGGAWTVTGVASQFSVSGGLGRMQLPAASTGASAALGSISAADVDAAVEATLDEQPNGSGAYVSLDTRRVGSSAYRAKIRIASGSVSLYLVRVMNNAETVLSSTVVPGLVYAPAERLRLRLQVTGTEPTSIRAKVWKTSGTEPGSWLLSSTDATAGLQTAGALGLVTYLSGSATNAPMGIAFDNLLAKPPTP